MTIHNLKDYLCATQSRMGVLGRVATASMTLRRLSLRGDQSQETSIMYSGRLLPLRVDR